jgi:hypothetical protein
MCRAVIITGLPFAPSFDPKVKMKREFLDQNRASQNIKASTNGGFGAKHSTNASLSGHEWYTQQAHRAVNQALGRVIRNNNDYGAILLLDSRFGQPGNQQGLSKWVRPHVQPDEGVGRAIGGLVKFYRNAESKARSREKEAPPPQAPNEVSIILKYEEECKENQSGSYNEDEFTKIAIIGKANEGQSGETSSTMNTKPEGNGSDGSPNRSYIPPERIIARVDMKTAEGSQKASKVMTHQDIETKAYPTPPKAARQNRGEGGMSGRPGIDVASEPKPSLLSQSVTESSGNIESAVKVHLATPANTSRTKKAGGSPSQTAAKQFFQQVQSRMSASEQSSIKKSVVAMKQFTHQKHRKAFLNAARDIIIIILVHESFENRPNEEKPELLALLFQLLPKHFLHDAQKYTMYMVLNQSNFGKSLKAALPSGDCRRCQSDTAALLWEIWFDGDGDERLSPTSFLQRLKKIIDPVLKQEGKSTSDMLCSFLKLIPLEYQSPTNALVDELEATRNIVVLRKMEKNTCGEDSVRTERFRTVPIKKESSLDKKDADRGVRLSSDPSVQKGNGQNMILKAGCNSDNSEQSNKRSNPYDRRLIGDQQRLKTGVGATNYTNRPVKVRRGLLLGSLIDSKQSQKRDGEDPVKKLLHQSESDTYTGKAKMNVANSMKSNAPRNLTCPICERASEKVRICTPSCHAETPFYPNPDTIPSFNL